MREKIYNFILSASVMVQHPPGVTPYRARATICVQTWLDISVAFQRLDKRTLQRTHLCFQLWHFIKVDKIYIKINRC